MFSLGHNILPRGARHPPPPPPPPPPPSLTTLLPSERSIERANDRGSERPSELQASDQRQSWLRRKACALLRVKTPALLRRKTCVVLRARTCASSLQKFKVDAMSRLRNVQGRSIIEQFSGTGKDLLETTQFQFSHASSIFMTRCLSDLDFIGFKFLDHESAMEKI